jgi:hypothetical protein
MDRGRLKGDADVITSAAAVRPGGAGGNRSMGPRRDAGG